MAKKKLSKKEPANNSKELNIGEIVQIKDNNKRRGKIIGISDKGKIVVEMSRYSQSFGAKDLEIIDKKLLERINPVQVSNNLIISKMIKSISKEIKDVTKLCEDNKTTLEEVILTDMDDSIIEIFSNLNIKWNCSSCGEENKELRCGHHHSTCTDCCADCYICSECEAHIAEDTCNECDCGDCCCECMTPEERERSNLL